MSTLALTDAFCYVGGHDFTGDSNELSLVCEAETRDVTTFRSNGWREHKTALKTSTLTLAGFWQSAASDAVDPETFDNLGVTGRVVTVGMVETEGQVAAMVQSMQTNYLFGGQVGDIAPYNLNAVGSDGVGVVHGTLLKEQGSVSAIGATGTAVELGAVSATQFLYGTFHTLGTPGTTITVVLESDADNTFASATTQITFGPITTATGTWGIRVAGPLADTWYRLRISAVTGTWTVAGAAGIQ